MDMLEGIATPQHSWFQPMTIARVKRSSNCSRQPAAPHSKTPNREVAVVSVVKNATNSAKSCSISPAGMCRKISDEPSPNCTPDALEERARIHKNRFAAIGLARDDAEGRRKAPDC